LLCGSVFCTSVIPTIWLNGAVLCISAGCCFILPCVTTSAQEGSCLSRGMFVCLRRGQSWY
jgi:hypothetical protein